MTHTPMKTLIAYYSRTGHTDQLARELAPQCGADLERIQDADGPRSGMLGYLRSGWQALRGTPAVIRPSTLDPGAYDLVIVGSPVWNWNLSAPVRAYAATHAARFKQVAFFCTEGGSGEERVFAELQRIGGRAPVATLAVKESELASGAYKPHLKRFVDQINARAPNGEAGGVQAHVEKTDELDRREWR